MENKIDKVLGEQLQDNRLKYSEAVMLLGEVTNSVRLLEKELEGIHKEIDTRGKNIEEGISNIKNLYGSDIKIDLKNMTYGK